MPSDEGGGMEIKMKKTIRIAFHSAVSESTIQLVVFTLKGKFNPIITKAYDYYFAMETIYHTQKNMRELLESNPDAIRIMLCGEAVYPDLNIFDYVIWHNNNYEALDRVIEYPLLYANKGVLYDEISELDDSKKNMKPKEILKEKTKFCNFIYANPNSHYMRDALFYEISKYKRVDSLGKHLKNTEIEDSRFVQGWEKISIKLKKPYKFSIAAENASFTGYTSEKLMTSMMANTIPIYWGNPLVGLEYNEKSFINVNNYDNFDDLVKKIREIDSNDQLYCDIMSQPWRTREQIDNCNARIEKYFDNFFSIFNQDIEKARRRPRGCWPDSVYANFFLKENKPCGLMNRAKSIIDFTKLLKINKK